MGSCRPETAPTALLLRLDPGSSRRASARLQTFFKISVQGRKEG